MSPWRRSSSASSPSVPTFVERYPPATTQQHRRAHLDQPAVEQRHAALDFRRARLAREPAGGTDSQTGQHFEQPDAGRCGLACHGSAAVSNREVCSAGAAGVASAIVPAGPAPANSTPITAACLPTTTFRVRLAIKSLRIAAIATKRQSQVATRTALGMNANAQPLAVAAMAQVEFRRPARQCIRRARTIASASTPICSIHSGTRGSCPSNAAVGL